MFCPAAIHIMMIITFEFHFWWFFNEYMLLLYMCARPIFYLSILSYFLLNNDFHFFHWIYCNRFVIFDLLLCKRIMRFKFTRRVCISQSFIFAILSNFKPMSIEKKTSNFSNELFHKISTNKNLWFLLCIVVRRNENKVYIVQWAWNALHTTCKYQKNDHQ